MILEDFPDILCSSEVMCILNVKKEQLYNLIRRKQIPAFKLAENSKSWLFNKDTLIEHLHTLEK